jgi:hypothetical protein
VLAAAAGCVFAAPASARLLDHHVFPDPAGDGAADITQVTVASNGSGAITFVLTVANREELGANEYAFVLIDSDLNPATGQAPNGIDYALQLEGEGAALFRWDGTQFVDSGSATVYGYAYNGLRVAVNRRDLGLTTNTLRFWVETQVGDSVDDAPDGAFEEYELSSKPLTLSVAQAGAVAKTVKVGKRFVVGLQAHRSDLDEITSAGRVRCAAKFGKRTVKVQTVFPEDVAICTGIAPKLAKGKTIMVTLTLELDGAKATRTIPVKIR